MSTRLISFDANGTLYTTHELLKVSMQKTLTEDLQINKNIDQELETFLEYNPNLSLSDKYIYFLQETDNLQVLQNLSKGLPDNLESLSQEQKEFLISKLTEIHEQKCIQLIPEMIKNGQIYVFDGVRELLENLLENDKKLVLITSKPKEETYLLLNQLDIKKYFRAILTTTSAELINDNEERLGFDLREQNNQGLTKKPNTYLALLLKHYNQEIEYHLGDSVDDQKFAANLEINYLLLKPKTEMTNDDKNSNILLCQNILSKLLPAMKNTNDSAEESLDEKQEFENNLENQPEEIIENNKPEEEKKQEETENQDNLNLADKNQEQTNLEDEEIENLETSENEFTEQEEEEIQDLNTHEKEDEHTQESDTEKDEKVENFDNDKKEEEEIIEPKIKEKKQESNTVKLSEVDFKNNLNTAVKSMQFAKQNYKNSILSLKH
jgi:phosphoglycolate phosphatase-like HAD superfamily hydrolase